MCKPAFSVQQIIVMVALIYSSIMLFKGYKKDGKLKSRYMLVLLYISKLVQHNK